MGNNYETIRNAIEAYLIYAQRDVFLKHGGVNVQYFSWISIYVKKDYTAILSIASCGDTWKLFKAAEASNLLHMAISEPDCPRLPSDKAITIPLISRGEELPQILLDLRSSNVYTWKTAVVLYDDTLSRDQVTKVVKSLTTESSNLKMNFAAVSLIKLNTHSSLNQIRKSINDIFSVLNTETVGRNFVAIVSIEIVEILMEFAKAAQFVNTQSQWLYVVSDTSAKIRNMQRFRSLLFEGDNIAFLYNFTSLAVDCLGGLQCHCEEILSAFTRSLNEAIVAEFETASQVSDEEWEAIRPNKIDRRNSLLQSIKKYLSLFGKCDNCTTWLMETGDTWGRENQPNSTSTAELISAGKWRPSDGASMRDQLFPHVVYGFRKRNLPLVSFHVCLELFEYFFEAITILGVDLPLFANEIHYHYELIVCICL